MSDSETTTEDHPGPITVEPAPNSGPLALWRRLSGRGETAPVIIEDAKGAAIDFVEPRAKPPAALISYFLLVIVPSLATVIYFAFLASDQYVAEARFAVRSAQQESLSDRVKGAMSNLSVSVSAPVMGGQDAYIVVTYIRSRRIIDDLSKTMDLREVFRRPEADFAARLKDHATNEELLDYWRQMVTAYIDGPSGIVTVGVRAFRPNDALALTKAIVTASEALANSVSMRARDDAMKRAEFEVHRGEDAVVASLTALREFREKSGMIDPISQATSTSVLLTSLMAEKIKLQNNLFVAERAMSPDAPTVQTLRTRQEELDRQIEDLKGKLTTGDRGGAAISSVVGKFEELEINRMFAEKVYESARDALERARELAEAQNIYIAIVVPPALPEEAAFPQRLALSLLTPIGLSILWGIFALIAAAIDDHRY